MLTSDASDEWEAETEVTQSLFDVASSEVHPQSHTFETRVDVYENGDCSSSDGETQLHKGSTGHHLRRKTTHANSHKSLVRFANGHHTGAFRRHSTHWLPAVQVNGHPVSTSQLSSCMKGARRGSTPSLAPVLRRYSPRKRGSHSHLQQQPPLRLENIPEIVISCSQADDVTSEPEVVAHKQVKKLAKPGKFSRRRSTPCSLCTPLLQTEFKKRRVTLPLISTKSRTKHSGDLESEKGQDLSDIRVFDFPQFYVSSETFDINTAHNSSEQTDGKNTEENQSEATSSLQIPLLNGCGSKNSRCLKTDKNVRRKSVTLSPHRLHQFLRQKLRTGAPRGDDSPDASIAGEDGRCFDEVLMEVVQSDASVVVDVIEDLRDLLRDDEHLSALVIRKFMTSQFLDNLPVSKSVS